MEISVEKQEPAQIELKIAVPQLFRLSKDAKADLWIAVTEDGLTTEVQRGENAGRRLAHMDVVRLLKSAAVLSESSGPKSQKVLLPLGKTWNQDKLKFVAFVQDRSTRLILAAAQVARPKARVP